MNRSYHISDKTKVFNFFRKLFKFKFLELFLSAANETPFSFIAGKLIPPPYLYSKGSFRYVKRNGLNFKFDLSDTVDHFIFFNYKDETLEAFFVKANDAKVILDIGANIGWTALRFANQNPTARVIAFEPHPNSYHRAQENININKLKNIECLNIGLGESKSTLKIYEVNENNSGMNRIVLEDLDRPFKEVHIEKLDDVMNELNVSKVDLIKLDVEGFEPFVLKGASEILSRSNAQILMETDDNFLKINGSSARDLISMLEKYGYKSFYRSDKKCFINADSDLSACHFDMLCKK